jgi:hypothetical protein
MKRKERGRNQCWEVTIVAGERPVHEEDEEGEESMLGVVLELRGRRGIGINVGRW